VADIAPVMLTQCDAQQRYVFVNAKYLGFVGAQPEQVIGRSVREVEGEEIYAKIEPYIDRVLAGEDVTFELDLNARGGEQTLVCAYAPERDAAGRVVGWVSALTEVTRGTKAAEALRESEARFRTLASHAPVGIFLSSAKGDCIFVNESWCRTAGLSPEAAMGQGWTTVLHPEDRERVLGEWAQAVRDGKPTQAEFRFLRPDGSVRWLQGSAIRFEQANGAGAGYIGTIADITTRKRVENELRRLASIVETSQDAIISKDLNGVITSWNSAAARLYGYTAAEAIGQPVTMLIPAERRDEEPGIMRRIRAGERIEHYETVRRRKDGSYVDISLSVSPLLDEKGAVIGASKIARDISANKRIEAALRESEERFRMVADNIAQFAWMTDAEGRRQWVNRRLLDYCGVTVEDLNRGAWSDLHHPEHLPRINERFREHIRSGAPWEDVFPVRGRDGTYRWFLAQAIPIRDAAGKVTRWFGTNTDIHELIEAKQALAARTETLERVNQLSSTLGAELDVGKIVQQVIEVGGAICSAECGAFFYRVPGRMGVKHIHCPLTAEAREKFEKIASERAAELFSSPSPAARVRIGDAAADAGYADASGDPAPVRSYLAVPVVSRSGERLGGLFFGHTQSNAFTEEMERVLVAIAAPAAIAIDNSQLYAALQSELAQHKAAEEALRRSERQLRLVTDNAIVYLAHCDREYRLKFVNRPYANRFGREPPELLGKHLAEIVGPEAFASFKPQIDVALAGRRTEFEIEIPYPKIGRRWVRVIHEPERDGEGRIVGLVAVILDITARKQTEQEIEAARDKALAASRAKDDFLAALSHELRTPLNPVLLLASEAAADPALPAGVRADFATIRKNVELEARLIDDLLDLTRITRGKLSLNLARQDVHAIVKDAVATMRVDLEQKGLAFACEFGADETVVWGDAVRLQQVLWNVLKNAVKFTPEGGRVSVRTRSSSDGERAIIEISDTGIGMTPAELARVFDAFSQGDHASAAGPHRFGGVGLGLTISRMLVELHRGRIEARSAGRGCGASFVIELPVIARDERPSVELSGTRTPTRAPFRPTDDETAAPVRLLLVEDHEPTRAALAQLLKRRNYDVVVASCVREALSAAAEAEIDVVVSDIGLPDGNGYDLMSELRRTGNRVGIALTGYGMDHDIVRSQTAGFAVHLTKPVTIQALDRALAAVANAKERA
jgi:PAS domain S-box-containing protein